MASREPSLGLCSTCNNGPVCIRRKGIRLPVLLCEEFDDHTPQEALPSPVSVNADDDPPIDAAMGLCCNCENRGSCTLQDSPGGVWHCEEYR